MESIYAYQVVNEDCDGYCRVMSSWRTEQAANIACARTNAIMKFRGYQVDEFFVRPFYLPEFTDIVEELVPGEKFKSTNQSAFRKCEQMLDMHYTSYFTWHAEAQDLEIHPDRYDDDKRNRSFERLCKLLEYSRKRGLAEKDCDPKWSIFRRLDADVYGREPNPFKE